MFLVISPLLLLLIGLIASSVYVIAFRGFDYKIKKGVLHKKCNFCKEQIEVPLSNIHYGKSSYWTNIVNVRYFECPECSAQYYEEEPNRFIQADYKLERLI